MNNKFTEMNSSSEVKVEGATDGGAPLNTCHSLF